MAIVSNLVVSNLIVSNLTVWNLIALQPKNSTNAAALYLWAAIFIFNQCIAD